MPGTYAARGNELYDYLCQVNGLVWSSPTLATVTATELTATIPGLNAGDWVQLVYNPPAGTSLTAVGGMPYGVTMDNFRCVANNTISVLWENSTAGTVTLPTGPFILNVVRPEAPNNLPSSAG